MCGVWAAKVRPARTVISLEGETFAAHVLPKTKFDQSSKLPDVPCSPRMPMIESCEASLNETKAEVGFAQMTPAKPSSPRPGSVVPM